MKVSKLIPNERILVEVATHNGFEHLANRATGRTTAVAMKLIASAMLEPGERMKLSEVKPRSVTCPQVKFNEVLHHRVSQIIEELKLDHFVIEVKNGDAWLYYDIFREVEVVEKTTYTVIEK